MNETISPSEASEFSDTTTSNLKKELSQIIISIFAMDSDPELVSNLKQILSGRKSENRNSVYQYFWFKMREEIRQTKTEESDQEKNRLNFALEIAREVVLDEKELHNLKPCIDSGIKLSSSRGSIQDFIKSIDDGNTDQVTKKEQVLEWLSSRIQLTTIENNGKSTEELDVASKFLKVSIIELKEQMLFRKFKIINESVFGFLDQFGLNFASFFIFVQGYELKQNILPVFSNLILQRNLWTTLSDHDFKKRVLEKLDLAEAILNSQNQETTFLNNFRKNFELNYNFEEVA